jgi:beta-N-acetylhexosaminidase
MRFLIKIMMVLLITFSTIALADKGKEENDKTLAFAVGQMMMVGFIGKTVDDDSPIVREIKDYHIGGILLVRHHVPHSKKFTTNIESPEQLKQLIKKLQYYAMKYNHSPLFIAINQEGGLINTLKPANGFDSANDLSQFELGKRDQKIIFSETLKRALFLKQLGINLNLAPVADLNIDPDNPAIGLLQRSFGSVPKKVTADLKSAIAAYRAANVFCTLKHFPGLGSANKNTDYHQADVTHTWKDSELQPYQDLIQSKNSCDFVMVSHLINKKLDKRGLPASLSKTIVSGLLIKKMGHQGLVMTDDMDALAIREYFSARDAILKATLAGNNVIIYGGTQGQDPEEDAKMLFSTLFALAKENPDIRARVYASYQKIMTIKRTLA